MSDKISTVTLGLISLVVVVLVIATVAIPIVESTGHSMHSMEKNAGPFYSVMKSTDAVTISYGASGPTLNGDALADLYDFDITMVLTVTSNDVIATSTYTVGTDTWSSWVVTSTAFVGDADLTLQLSDAAHVATWSDGTFEITVGEDEFTSTYDFVIRPDVKGNYGLFVYSPGSAPWYVDSGKEIYVVKRVNAQSYVTYGTVDDMNIGFVIVSNTEVSGASIAATYTPTAYNASNEVTTFVLSDAGGASISGAYMLLPLEYTTISSQQNMYSSLLYVIPLLLLLIPILGCVQFLNNRRE